VLVARSLPPRSVPQSTGELEQRIRGVLAETLTPGLALSLVSRDQVLWSAGIGTADIASGRPATADTLFRVGSISKTFVALMVLTLQREGRLNLNDGVRSLAPEVQFDNPVGRDRSRAGRPPARARADSTISRCASTRTARRRP
jgi:CubicO group peptidase (beta-lactamase class C family)